MRPELPEARPDTSNNGTVTFKASTSRVARWLKFKASGLTQRQIAEVEKVSESVVSHALEPFRVYTELAKARLQGASLQAAEAWIDALEPSARRGRHEPARDLLAAVGVVKPEAATPSVQIVIGQSTAVSLQPEFPQPIDTPVVSDTDPGAG